MTSENSLNPSQKQEVVPVELNYNWVHFFKSMVFSGDVARLGPYAFTTLMLIKAHGDWRTGVAFPEVERIAELGGMGKTSVKKSLPILVNEGFLKKTKRGRKNYYQVRERISLYEKRDYEVQGEEVEPFAKAEFDYNPSQVAGIVDELRNLTKTGRCKRGTINVHIDKVVVQNIQNQTNILNIQIPSGPPSSWEDLTEEMVNSIPAGQLKDDARREFLKRQENLINDVDYS